MKKSLVLYIGDLHLKISRFEESKALLSWIENTVAEVKPQTVVYLGDTFDTHAAMRSEIVSIFTSHLLAVSKYCGGIIHLLGNHEMVRQDSYAHHALTCLKSIPNVEVVDEPRIIDGTTYIPYVHDHNLFPKIDTQLAVSHQTFLGSQYSGFRPKEGVDVKSLGCELMISGHIHERQEFDSVIYPGTPIATSLSDVNQDKGILIMNTSTFKRKYIESPFPRYRSWEINETSISLPDIKNNDRYIVKVVGSKTFCSSFLSSKDAKDLTAQGVMFRPSYTDSIKVDRVVIQSRKSIKEMAGEYIDKVLATKDAPLIKEIIEGL